MTIVVTTSGDSQTKLSTGKRVEVYSAINVTDFIIGSIIYLGGTRTEGEVWNESGAKINIDGEVDGA